MSDYLWSQYDGSKNFAVETAPYITGIENRHCQDGRSCWLINPLPRFAGIFRPIFETPDDECPQAEKEARELFANLAFHVLAGDDFLLALTWSRLEQLRLLKKLENGDYGDKVKNVLSTLTVEWRERIATLLYRQEKERRTYFVESLKAFFPECRIYHYKDENKFLVYMPYGKTENNQRLLELIEYLFCDLASVEREYFWLRPFCIIDEDPSMIIDNSVIY